MNRGKKKWCTEAKLLYILMRTTSAQTGIKLLTRLSDDKVRELHVEHENMQTEAQ